MLNTKILVVDDDPAFRGLMERFLAHEGAEVITAGAWYEALAAFDAQQPDLVILDAMMPRVDGFETCRLLRERSAVVPIIMVSALDRSEDVIRGLHGGADDFIVKPFNLVVLRARIDAALRRAAPRQGCLTHR